MLIFKKIHNSNKASGLICQRLVRKTNRTNIEKQVADKMMNLYEIITLSRIHNDDAT